MFAPNLSTHQLADQMHHERLSHAARMQAAAEQHGPKGTPLDREAQRRITVRRLTATLAGAALSVALVAGAAATLGSQPDPASAPATVGGGAGGGATHIR
jgi:hypothetical protein